MITLENIDIAYGSTPVLSDLSLHVPEGEFFTLLGPSGCGKSTLLRAISGFVRPSRGRVIIDGRDMTALAPEDRGIGVVFQNYALFPHLSVYDNVAFGLRVARTRKKEIEERVSEALERIGVADHARKKPAELSGGQQQRVAIARALILGAKILLLDEPLSNLDAKLREAMRDEIRDIQQRLRLTTVYVTHDQAEALALSDRVAVMEAGHLCQVGPPRALYTQPATPFVCAFVGESSRLADTDGIAPASFQGVAFVRPEDVHLGEKPGEGWVTFDAVLDRAVFQGARVRLLLRRGDSLLLADAPGYFDDRAPGETVTVSIHADKVHRYPGDPA
ncbi:ABC transporter ATP-binding protein [Oricola sp.]|uniref:ABC transporter ATP-binding protein n=1 Tax=Oricola sp. TaxID=1979950 RepID=UPI0025CD1640|nr:ABC transporter ATP-binding protein [Oricola sp.]MCI5077940.1 ABC transporter ATP-binding protein [Oricola sp.]